MLPDRVSNPGPLTYESGVLPIALRGPAHKNKVTILLQCDKLYAWRLTQSQLIALLPSSVAEL